MIDFNKLIKEVHNKELQFVITKGKNKFYKSVLISFQVSNSLKPVLIASSPRSGSTWILECLLRNSRYRAVFEPIPSLEESKRIYNLPRIVLSENTRDNRFNNYINLLLAPNALNKKKWRRTDLNSRNIYFLTKGIAIKSTRANFCLSFIEKNVKQDMKIIYLIRNPFSIIKSRIIKSSAHGGKLSSKFLYNPRELFNCKDIFFKAYFEKYKQVYNKKVKDNITLQAFIWCIENKHIIEQIKDKNWLLVVYENLYTDFYNEFKRICDYIQIPYKKKIAKNKNVKSTTSFSGEKAYFIKSFTFFDKKKFLNDWREFFHKKSIIDIVNILYEFEINYKEFLNNRVRSLVNFPW